MKLMKRSTARKMRRSSNRIRRTLQWPLYSPAERRHSKVGPPKLWKMKRYFQIQFLEQVGLKPHHHLFDLGCGTLRGGIPIIEYLEKGHYFGVDIRPKVLNEARKELKESELVDKEPTIILAEDLASLDLDKKFDYVWAFSVLIHMEDTILYDALGFVRHHLKDDGCFYGNVNIVNRSDDRGKQGSPKNPKKYRSSEFYEEACWRNGLRVEDMGPLTDFGHYHPGQTVEEQARKRMLKIWKV